jgi:hypothetical protein
MDGYPGAEATKQMQLFLKADHVGDVIINVLIIALLPAICEEYVFAAHCKGS